MSFHLKVLKDESLQMLVGCFGYSKCASTWCFSLHGHCSGGSWSWSRPLSMTKGWFPLSRKFYGREFGFTCVNEIRDDVWTAYVNVKSLKLSTLYVYVSCSYIVSNFIYVRTHKKFTRQWKSTVMGRVQRFELVQCLNPFTPRLALLMNYKK